MAPSKKSRKNPRKKAAGDDETPNLTAFFKKAQPAAKRLRKPKGKGAPKKPGASLRGEEGATASPKSSSSRDKGRASKKTTPFPPKPAPSSREPKHLGAEVAPGDRASADHPFVRDHLYEDRKRPFGLARLGGEGRQKGESTDACFFRLYEQNELLSQDVADGVLLSMHYSGTLNKAYAKVYDLQAHAIKIWVDNTNHEPYCLSDYSPAEIQAHPEIQRYKGYKRVEAIDIVNLLQDDTVSMSKVYGYTPTDVGGGRRNLREILKDKKSKKAHAWEAKIRYHHNFIYDRALVPGMAYRVDTGNLERLEKPLAPGLRTQVEALFADEQAGLREFARANMELFFQEIPEFRRVALDIETTCVPGKVPNPRVAKHPVISIAFKDSTGKSWVYVLLREGHSMGTRVADFPDDLAVTFFRSERDLIRETFRVMWEYPLVVTFNGDNFDLNYLYHRARKFRKAQGGKIPREENPIVFRNVPGMRQGEAQLLHGIHVDLYRVFSDRSLKGYAFGNAYDRNGLDDVASALLGEGKFQHEEEIHDMSLFDLIYYNWKDADVTLRLTQFNDSVAMRILVLLARMTKLPFHEVYRYAISAWIRNMLFYEHRQQNYLIPNRHDLRETKPGGFSRSVIDGKGFKGAYVIEPVPGRHYGVVVMDFASLYPSIIKEYNLSYETVLCPHPACRDNMPPGVPIHVCTQKMGIFAILVGFFRDIRVKWFKPRSADESLPEAQSQFAVVVQSALKVFINGSYGVFGSPNFDLFCLPVAESTTAIGRASILRTIDKATELGVEVLYGDSDSVFLNAPTPDQVQALQAWAADELLLELDPEKTYQFLALSDRKKNYLGVYEGGGYIDLKGLTGKKKNTPEFIKKVIARISDTLAKIQSEEDFQRERQNIIRIVQRSIKWLKYRKFPLEDYAIYVQMKKDIAKYNKTTPQHVKAAKMLRDATDVPVARGDVIGFVKANTAEGVKPLRLAKRGDVDVRGYQKLLRGALEQILDALEISFEECKGVKKLDAFF